ncbi:N-6 DNA methylase [Limnothrix sp. FACHB-1083]|uniref:type ISP restriction/modification enzyme n=1 Tax=unclassified Limnothrix TaxID=2632864 RepID=UPI001680C5F2|nr:MULTISPECIES: type ISP restriction/modification enzyme [unclassified Limnothrix]MBD2161597.1 N-6 DNA methylase [Limnothrix sp. FACHB-1083]MBD2192310.1 N-6 DNA methylase [Limnothrix sp. FACHB-1088]
MGHFEQYIQELRDIRATGAAVKETSYYTPLVNLLNAIGTTLKPKVRCFMQLKNLGAGMPDGGLFTARQYQRQVGENPNDPQNPERGVIEIKSTGDDAWVTAATQQVIKYWDKYRQVLVTNYRDFVLIGQDINGQPIQLEAYRLAANEKEFWQKAQNPRAFAQEHEEQIIEYLKRVMLQKSVITAPQDLAWFLASYAKDARARISKSDLPALQAVRTALEDALGIQFQDQKGDHFFKSTLIQTLFYGIFSAWVLWHKQGARRGYFDWQTAAWSLHVPMVRALFEKVATPTNLGRLDLVEVLDWAGEVLNRVDRTAFFAQFDEGQAVQYFYEPFLEAFDPQLRKDLGVWYTPPEIVQYMVARVDTALREELDIVDGLADENVYILDPCCGTGAFLVEVLKRIHQTLLEKGDDALVGIDLKEAAKNRVFGFEILTAPFVVAHLQLGLVLQSLGASLQGDQERVGVYLTNALTGWEPPNDLAKQKFQQLTINYPELQAEREAADEIKRGKPILVVLGNPPYNAYAGVSPKEEEGMVEVYKRGLIEQWGIKKFNLDDLYVRFFRVAEFCISKQAIPRGVVCFISNFSYLSDPSYAVMRQQFLKTFDQLWFDCLNGDSRETGKRTPEGNPDPSVFSTQYNRAGIKTGTTIALMIQTGLQSSNPVTRFRHFWGVNKREDLLKSLQTENFAQQYAITNPIPETRFSFRPSNIEPHYLEWAKVTDFCAVAPSNGLMEKRGGSLIDIDRDALEQRMQAYFNPDLDWEAYKALNYGLVKTYARFEPKVARRKALLEARFDPRYLLRYAIRPFEVRWCYYSGIRPIWNEPRPFLWKQCWPGNKFLLTRFKAAKDPEGNPFYFTPYLSDDHLLTPDAVAIPLQLKNGERLRRQEQLSVLDLLGERPGVDQPFANLSATARQYLTDLGFSNPDHDSETAHLIWLHVLAIGYSSAYLQENADGIRQDWPRIPLPQSRDLLLTSATLGRQIASYLDTETKVDGVTTGKLDSRLRSIAVASKVGGGQLNLETDLALLGGWGSVGKDGATMPGKGKLQERLNNSDQALLGAMTYDIYLNDVAYWKNIPDRVWNYTIGGYQVIKKWLSYREEPLLGRPLKREEVQEVSNMARRIAALLFLEPQLNANYEAVKEATYPWSNFSQSK